MQIVRAGGFAKLGRMEKAVSEAAGKSLCEDCAELRILEDHLWHLAEVCGDLVVAANRLSTTADRETLGFEWLRMVRWLRMAAGLRYVDVDMAYGETPLLLCGKDDEENEAESDTVSAFVTEQTRLLYTWNAVDRLLKVLRLPPVPEADGPYNRATQLLKDRWAGRDLPPHFECVVTHLRRHIEGDRWLRHEPRLASSLEARPWRDESGVLLAAANQMRHLPAHGALEFPSAARSGRIDPSPAKQVPQQLHAARLASRGLALSIAMLVVAARPDAHLDGERTPREGWRVLDRDGSWRCDAAPSWKALFEQAHLRSPLPEEYGLFE